MTEENKSVKNFPNSGDLGIPKLRFTEFGIEKWETKRLGEIATFTKGKGISKSDIYENGETECIRYGELYTFYEEVISEIKSKTNTDISSLVLSEANDVIIPASGETQIDIATASCVLKSGVALGGDLNIIKTKNNGVFLSYYLNSKKKLEIAKLSQGISVVHLYSSQLALLNLKLPQLEEQNKLATFLSLLNSRIQTQKKIIEDLVILKSNTAQNIFNQVFKFKDSEGNDFRNWQIKKLGDVCEIKRGASPRPISDSKWFDDDSKIGWVRISDVTKSDKYLEKTEQYLSNAGISKSRLVKKGNMIMSICATIGKPIYTNFDVCIHDGFVVFENLTLDKEFLYYYLDFIQLNWYKYGQPGIQVNLNSEIVNNESVVVPVIEEQIKIAEFLSKFDEKIKLENELLTQYENQKKYLLQNLFV